MAEGRNPASNGVRPPVEAGPGRRVFHTLLAVAGWVLFGYWWWLVFHRVSGQEVRFTALFIAFSLAIIVLVTAAWAFHNLSIYARRGPRKRIREVRPDFSHDRVGRDVTFRDAASLQRAAVVYVGLGETGKVYEARGAVRPAASPAPAPPAPAAESRPRPEPQSTGEGGS